MQTGAGGGSGFITRGDGVRLAYAHTPGRAPTLVFLPGFMSDMTGDKARALTQAAQDAGFATLRLDYSGHGASGGAFEDGTIGIWRDDALAVIDACTTGPLLLIGSSMGGWIALLAALQLGTRVCALIGIAAAPDFTETLLWPGLPPQAQAAILRDGVWRAPSPYGGEQVFTRALLEDGRRHLLLGAPIALNMPVHLFQGMQDPDVPWATALAISDTLAGGDVRLTLIKDGDHRLSRPQDIALLCRESLALLRQNAL